MVKEQGSTDQGAVDAGFLNPVLSAEEARKRKAIERFEGIERALIVLCDAIQDVAAARFNCNGDRAFNAVMEEYQAARVALRK
jgi:hypothetical protein